MTEAEQVGLSIARMTSSAGTCGARSCSDSVDWASYERICNLDTISRRGSQAGIDGCPKIQGMTAGSFLLGKLFKPRADGWIRIRVLYLPITELLPEAYLASALIETFTQ
jgi:hypothetical protein